MVQTKAGAQKAVAKLKEKYGEDHFAKLGQKGGKVKRNLPPRNKQGQWIK